MGRIVTFYSYKGGTGRSMALSNVAWILASNDQRVLIIDWDLEAPGLHRYLKPFLTDKDLTGPESEGIIDLVVNFSVQIATPQADALKSDWYEQYADISKWSIPLVWPSGEMARLGRGGRGRIDFVPAGKQGPQYANKVNSFDWANFYERLNGGAFFDAVRRSMKSYDWVLIDSRTGVSDTAGICTLQLPDVLVVCFTLNYQSIDGVAAAASSVKKARPEIIVWPVPMRIDGSEEKLLKKMKAYAEKTLSPLLEPYVRQKTYWFEMEVAYVPHYAYSEKLAPFEDQTSILTSTLPSMERIASYITDRSITSLGPIPEEHRKAALAEFERSPSEFPLKTVGEERSPSAWIWSFLGRAGRRLITTSWAMALVTGISTYLALGGIDAIKSFLAPRSTVKALLSAARDDLQAGSKDPAARVDAALLLAEAARRIQPDPNKPLEPGDRNSAKLMDLFYQLAPLRIGHVVQEKPFRIVRFSVDGTLVATAGDDKVARAFHSDGSGMTVSWQVPNSGWALAFSPDGKYLASGGPDGTSLIFDVRSLRLLFLVRQDKAVHSVAFSSDSKTFAAGGNSFELAIYAVSPWHQLGYEKTSGSVLDLAFSPDGNYLGVASMGHSANLFNLHDLSPDAAGSLDLAIDHFGPVRVITFAPSPIPLRVATASTDGTVRVLTVPPNARTSSLTKNTEVLRVGADVYAATFSPDGQFLAAGSVDGTTSLWSTKDWKLSRGFSNAADVRALAFSPDSKRLAIGSGDGTARIVEVTSGREMQRFTFQREVNSVAFSPDGKYLATAGSDGMAATWLILPPRDAAPSLTSAKLVSLACLQTNRSLSASEWRQYFGSEPYSPACKAKGEALP
jgi:WD40 repeat protein/cellulose biosynthesis protein BcsQ